MAAAGAWAYQAFGLDQADHVLFAAGMAAMALGALAVAVVLLAALWLWLAVRPGIAQGVGRQIEAGAHFETGLTFSSLRWWPLVEVDLSWESPEVVAVEVVRTGGQCAEIACPLERGWIRQVVRRFRVHDIFGLASVDLIVRGPAAIRVAPALGRLTAPLAHRMVSGDGVSHPAGEPVGERIETRPYAPGDSARQILWKTYARTRRLLVRVPERAIVSEPSTVAYFVAGPGDESSAAVARAFLEANMPDADIRFAADGAPELTARLDVALERLIDSVRFREEGGAGLSHLGASVGAVQLGSCIVFVPSRPGPWVQAVERFARIAEAPPTLVLAVDGRAHLAPRSRLGRWLLHRPAGGGALAEVPALCDALRRIRGRLQVVRRDTGELVSARDIEALRAT